MIHICQFYFILILFSQKIVVYFLIFVFTLLQTGSPNVHFCLPQVSSAFFKMMFTLFIYVPDGEISLFVISQTLETVKRLCPKQTLLIGMNHKFDHHKDNEFLMEWSRRYTSHFSRKSTLTAKNAIGIFDSRHQY